MTICDKCDASAQAPVILIALGANLPSRHGGPQATLEAALRRMEGPDLHVARRARWIATPAFPAGSGPDYVNGAALLETALAPMALLERLLALEAELGRIREGRWGPRPADLDLLAYGALVAPDEQDWRRIAAYERPPADQPALALPHPRLHQRGFVLAPAAEIAPEWVHPVLGLSLAQMLGALPEEDKAQIRLLE